MTPKKDSIPAPYAEYMGSGAFIQGVPARDLSKAEWDALTDEQRAVATTLYAINLTGE